MRPFDCCKPERLNSILVLRSTGDLIRSCWLSRSALPATPQSQSCGRRGAQHGDSALQRSARKRLFCELAVSAYCHTRGEGEAERAIKLLPSSKDNLYGPGFEGNLALIQTIFGENSRPISTLMRLLQTPYLTPLYGPIPITPALLRLDPLWDPLRIDPAFQKLREETKP